METTLRSALADRYDIERPLGSGGMATVYLARDLKHARRVAIKVVNPEISESVSTDRFLREISVAARLAHPYILPLHDSGEADGLCYYVMPYVEGETLRARLRRERQLPLDDALRIACEVASALDYAHRQQVLHRDVKPENILLEDDHAILADFGIARAIGAAADSGMTATGVTLGTPAYMSPEQVTGSDRLDGRSDVYSLSCVLYEMLAGEPPFTGATAQSVIAKRLYEPPPHIRTVRPSVPEPIERVLLRGLDRTPADRFATAEQFREALAACARHESGAVSSSASASAWPSASAPGVSAPAAVRPLPTELRTPAWTRQRRLGAAALLGALSVVAVGWAVVRWIHERPVATIAVLPFVNESADPEQAFLAQGLADALMGDLAGVPNVRLVSRMSVMQYANAMGGAMSAGMPGGMSYMGSGMAPPAAGGSGMAMRGPKSLADIATELNAEVLLQASVAREGDTVRVNASLLGTAPLRSLWEGTYTRRAHELFALQRELGAAVVAAVTGSSAESAMLATSPREYAPSAHEAYLKGAYFQAHWRLSDAIEAFGRAVALDASHAPAQAGLSRAYYFLGFFGDIPPSIALGGMRRAAEAALASDPLLAEGHAQLALVKMLQDWDWAAAERHFRRALELSPGHAQIRHDYAHFLLGQGRQRESMEQTRQALALDPVNPMLISCLGWHSLFDARFDDAIRFAEDAHAMMPDHWAQLVLGWALLGQDRPEAAVAALREAVRLKESAFTLASLGNALAAIGEDDEARRVLGQLLERMERQYVSPYDIAAVYAGLGEADGAFRWLRRAAEERSMFIVHVGWDSRFDRVRTDMRFADLTARDMRLPSPEFAVRPAASRRTM